MTDIGLYSSAGPFFNDSQEDDHAHNTQMCEYEYYITVEAPIHKEDLIVETPIKNVHHPSFNQVVSYEIPKLFARPGYRMNHDNLSLSTDSIFQAITTSNRNSRIKHNKVPQPRENYRISPFSS